ncbi:MAG: YifB family Mg chelatase-like AAA ATPase [Candidatus Liptonbacteria bacterium]|nr:YifB family Mg chelatase-like AAA ATPase [Candidatus Liptonbacteria bacterium]
MREHLARVHSAELEGIHAKLIEVEVDLNVGLHAFNIVGLADKALNEARERVNSSLKNSGVKPPNRENRKITVNLAPADVKKAGAQYDLAIAIGYLLATHQIKKFETHDKIFMGELALDGRLRPIHGALNIAHMAAERGFQFLFLPKENANEAAVVKKVKVVSVENLLEAIEIIETRRPLVPHTYEPPRPLTSNAPDFADIKGQENAKRALMIAAAGGHNLLMSGPPGVGKSLLAHAMVGILPPMNLDESIEVTKVWSAAGIPVGGLLASRPFRAPHQTATLPAIVGGGSDPKPGEISLAHRGILFLDEFPEFQRHIVESLRAPMEMGAVRVARARGTLSFPARFTLVAAMNPCPCGYYGDQEKDCKCAAFEVIRYQKKISGPIVDRIDLHVSVPRVPIEELRTRSSSAISSKTIIETIAAARALQESRFKNLSISTNAEMNSRQTENLIHLQPAAETFLEKITKTNLSPRSYFRLLKTARTIADLESQESVGAEHVAEAWSYRIREEA